MTHTSEVKRFQPHCRTTVKVLSFLLFSASLLLGQIKPPPAPGTPDGNQPYVQFPVAYAQDGSWSLGNLTITGDGVRFYGWSPRKGGLQTFRLNRSELTSVNRWMNGANKLNAVEIRTASKIYHFWVLQAAASYVTVHQPEWTPANAGPADFLLVSLYYWMGTGEVPEQALGNAALARAVVDPNNPDAVPGNDNFAAAARKVNDHLDVNIHGNETMTHSISTINHMSHW